MINDEHDNYDCNAIDNHEISLQMQQKAFNLSKWNLNNLNEKARKTRIF